MTIFGYARRGDTARLDRRPEQMRSWTLCSATVGPLALVCAWLLAASVQPVSYSPMQQSISALADYSADERWIMTAGLYVIGACQLITAAGLRELRPLPRSFLAGGGVAGLGVAFFPQPVHGPTGASPHIIFATLSVMSLAAWPAIIGSRGLPLPGPLTARAIATVTSVFAALLVWVYVAGHGAGALGLAERVDTTVETLWPLVIVLVLRRHAATAARPAGGPG